MLHRSSSSTRVSEDYYLSSGSGSGRGPSSMDIDQLPTYDPLSEAAKREKEKEKEALRTASLENMVHIIPFLIILCALVLWFFSYPAFDVANIDESIIARIKNMTIDGYSNWNGSIMTTGLEDLDPIDQIGLEETDRVG